MPAGPSPVLVLAGAKGRRRGLAELASVGAGPGRSGTGGTKTAGLPKGPHPGYGALGAPRARQGLLVTVPPYRSLPNVKMVTSQM